MNTMFDPEQSIANWRQQMFDAGIKSPAQLHELENHLREEILAQVSSGLPEPEAFQVAVTRVGHPQSVAAEFEKSLSTSASSAKYGVAMWIVGATGLSLVLLSKWIEGQISLLFLVHVLTMTAGYGTAFLIGGMGMYYVCRRLIPGLLPLPQALIQRTIRGFSQLAAALTIAGMLLGVLWQKLNHGQFLSGEPREIGALTVIGWMVAISLVQRRRRLQLHMMALLGILGSMIVSLAWFGAGSLEHGHRFGSYWPLNLLLAVHLFFLLLGLLPAAKSMETGKEHYV